MRKTRLQNRRGAGQRSSGRFDKPVMKVRLCLAALSAALLATRFAAAETLAPPLSQEVDQVFATWDRPDSAGCALGVYKAGEVVYARGYGMEDLNEGAPITPDTVFHIASMSKQFTAASIILLSEQGKLSLDDDIHKYIPELPDFGAPITIRELLHHTSGIRDQWNLLDLSGWRLSRDLITNDDVMSVLTKEKDLNFKPGERFLYSNTGFTLLGLIVQRVSGESLREFTSENIFKPLGMSRTFFRDDHAEVIKHDAVGYERAAKDKPYRISITNYDTVGATSLHTTVEDLQRWDENFYHPKVGGPALIRTMLEQGRLNSGEVIPYAAGLEIGTYRGLRTVDHAGADAGYRTDMRRFPDQHFTVAVLCNAGDAYPSGLALKVADILLGSKLAPEAAPTKTASSPAQLSALTGLYWDPVEDAYVRIILKDGKSLIDLGRGDPHPLTADPQGQVHFDYAPGIEGTIQVSPASHGAPLQLAISRPDDTPSLYHAVPAAIPTPSELKDYVGPYVSEEIDPIYRISVTDGKLTLARLKNAPAVLKPATKDVFTARIGTLRFVRDANLRVTGFVLDGGRVKNFKFMRMSPTPPNP